ncbi:MAG: hypothetical protein PHE88_04115 [Elusimicrobia bacterium]|nr:hypothetical protein [Elusimicrobiota bacterium]
MLSNPKKNSIILKLTVTQIVYFFVLIVGLGIIMYFYQKNILMEQFFSNTKTIVQIYASSCSDAKESKDDILLLSYVDRIKKLPDVIKVMILDSEARVSVNSEKSEIGQIMKDDFISKNITLSNNLLVQTYQDITNEYYVFSMPIFLNMKKVAFLRVDFSSESVKTAMNSYKEKIIIVLVLMLTLVAIGVYIISFRVGKGINELTVLSDAIANEKYDEPLFNNISKRNDEIGVLAKVLLATMETVKKNYTSYEEKLSFTRAKFSYFLQSIGKNFAEGVIFLDQDNKIVYINSPACGILSIPIEGNIGKHILEMIKDVEFIDTILESVATPNQIIKKELINLKTSVAVTAVQEEVTSEIIGSIIVF